MAKMLARDGEGAEKLIEVRIDPQAITPNTTLDKIRAAALK